MHLKALCIRGYSDLGSGNTFLKVPFIPLVKLLQLDQCIEVLSESYVAVLKDGLRSTKCRDQ